jgi:hypothetical protein
MNRNPSFEMLRADLVRRGLPTDYARRAVQELADHHADLLANGPTREDGSDVAWRSLGNAKHLADNLVREYRAQTLIGRHPWITFVLAPAPVALVWWTATLLLGWMFVFGVVAPALDFAEGETVAQMDLRFVWTLVTFHYASLAAPPAIAAWWFSRLARRSGLGVRWITAACALIALVALVVVSDLRLPYESHQGRLIFGLALPLPEAWIPRPFTGFLSLGDLVHPATRLWQMVGPLAVMLCALWQPLHAGRSNWTVCDSGD